MSASDGYVGSMTKIVKHGRPSRRWNLVVLGDGYRDVELPKYHTDVQNFVDTLHTTSPFHALWHGINIYRIDVVSTDSGADEPVACGGSGATPRTYFDATFCRGGIDRLLTLNSSLAKAVAKGKLAAKTLQVLVIVNSPKYGGSGGSVAVCSTDPQAADIAIHEIGHSAFGLADEYENGGSGTGFEPAQPNVTIHSNLNPGVAPYKWSDLVTPGTHLPTSCNPGCACASPPTPPAPGTVGTHEGALYARCDVFRPLENCYMRDYHPFCPACERVIRQTLQPYLPSWRPAPSP